MASKNLLKNRSQQRSLFSEQVCSAYLVADNSPQKAFYRIYIEKNDFNYVVCKESGSKGRTLDKRAWSFGSIDEARKLYGQRIKSKTNPDRKSLRKYHLVEQTPE